MVVVSVLTTKGSLEAIKCKHCQVKAISRQTSSIKFKFYRVLEVVIKRLISNEVSATDILTSLPLEIGSRLRSEGATTINDLFRESGALDKELKWYSFSLLRSLVEEFGDNKCKQELTEYTKDLQTYLQSRSLTRTPTSLKVIMKYSAIQQDRHPQASTDVSPAVEVVVDPEWDKTLVDPEGDRQERAYIASLLNTTINHIHFIET